MLIHDYVVLVISIAFNLERFHTHIHQNTIAAIVFINCFRSKCSVYNIRNNCLYRFHRQYFHRFFLSLSCYGAWCGVTNNTHISAIIRFCLPSALIINHIWHMVWPIQPTDHIRVRACVSMCPCVCIYFHQNTKIRNNRIQTRTWFGIVSSTFYVMRHRFPAKVKAILDMIFPPLHTKDTHTHTHLGKTAWEYQMKWY